MEQLIVGVIIAGAALFVARRFTKKVSKAFEPDITPEPSCSADACAGCGCSGSCDSKQKTEQV